MFGITCRHQPLYNKVYSNNHLRTQAMYSHNAFVQIFNTGSANAGISGADMASSGTGSYNSNGGFVLGGSTRQSGAGGE